MNKIKRFNDMVDELRRNQHLLAAILLLFVLAIFYRDVVFNGKTFLMETAAPGTMPNAGPYNYKGVSTGFVVNDSGAIAWAKEPLNRYISKSVKNGDFPLWNPYAGLAGSPLFADGHTGSLEPVQFLFFFIPDWYWPYAVDTQLLLRFLLAGFFCYLFARRLKIDFLGGVSAGILFMLSSYFVTYGNHPQIKTEALLPLVLYGYDRLVDFEDKQAFWFCALFIGWAIIAAMPEATFFILFLGALWYFYKSIIQVKETENRFTAAKNTFLRDLGSTILGFLISSVYLLPFFEFVSFAKSIHSAGTGGVSFPLWKLPNLIFQIPGSFYLQLGFFAIFCLFFSLLHLKEWALKYGQSPIFFGLYSIIFIFMIYDFPPTNWIRTLPVLNQLTLTKYPIPSIVFCLAILAGMLIDGIIYTQLLYRKVFLPLLIIFILFIGLPALGYPSKSLDAYFASDNSIRFVLMLIISVLARWTLILVELIFVYKSQKISGRVLQVGLLLLIVAELFFGGGRITRLDRIDPFHPPPFVDYLQGDNELFRIFGLDGILYPNISTAYRLADIRWLYALIPKRTYDFSAHFIESKEVNTIRLTGTVLPISAEMFDLLNVKYILKQSSHDSQQTIKETMNLRRYSLVYQDQDVEIYRNDNVFPRAFMAYNIVNTPTFDKALNLLSNRDLNLRQTAVVERLPTELTDSINENDHQMQSEAGSAKLINSSELEVKVNTKAPGLLIVTDQYYPGWRAYVNGKLTPIYVVDGIFRGVFLNKGDHIIEFKYQPSSFMLGALLSAISLLIVFVFLAINRNNFLRKQIERVRREYF